MLTGSTQKLTVFKIVAYLLERFGLLAIPVKTRTGIQYEYEYRWIFNNSYGIFGYDWSFSINSR